METANYVNDTPFFSFDEVNDFFMTRENGVTLVKLRAFFKKIEDQFVDPVGFKMQIPSSEIGSITLLEASIIVSLLKLTQPKSVFEFGTYYGYSTALLANNTEKDTIIYSIDLDTNADELAHAESFTSEDIMTNDIKNDTFLSYSQAKKGAHYLNNLPDDVFKKIKLLKGDSTTYDYRAEDLINGVDYVFVDGGHDLYTIKEDTKNALEMIGENGIVLWHDFNSRIHFDVTKFLNKYSETHKVFHVEHTMIAFMVVGSYWKKLFDSL